MTVGSQLLELAIDYLGGSADLDALDMWLARHAQELASLNDDHPMARLAGLMQVTLAEMDDEVATKADLDSRVAGFLRDYLERLTPSMDSLNSTAEPLGGEVVVSSTVESPQTVEYIAA